MTCSLLRRNGSAVRGGHRALIHRFPAAPVPTGCPAARSPPASTAPEASQESAPGASVRACARARGRATFPPAAEAPRGGRKNCWRRLSPPASGIGWRAKWAPWQYGHTVSFVGPCPHSLTDEDGEPARVINRPITTFSAWARSWERALLHRPPPPLDLKPGPPGGHQGHIPWPRPASPPVVKLEIFYNSEYSMPSTHAMSGTAIPIAMVLLTYGRWQYPLLYGLILIPCWCSLVCLSRIYMGMHSILDIIAGFLYTILILAVFYPLVDMIDHFNQTHRYAPLIIIGLHLALGIFSFTLDTWSTSRGDTAEILGSGAGVACGSHVTYNMGLLLEPSLDTLPLARPPLTVTLVGKAILRIFIGMVFVVIVRDIMKKITIPLACRIFKIPCDDIRKARQHMEVELPYRYITYGMVGFSITFLIPYIFSFIGIS
uniref:Phosphatidic acid phosphatase type 2/haloperoxidase domain-containing protein n=1 Tax=Oryctolagus cuniculus TaxID=9986 RepID=G1ST03_RABIT